jgi:hypothetical protein
MLYQAQSNDNGEHFEQGSHDAFELTEENHENLGATNPATANGMCAFRIQVGRN